MYPARFLLSFVLSSSLVFFTLSLEGRASPQQVTSTTTAAPQPVQRDPQALAIVQQSITAMGGTVPSDSTAMGTVTTVAGSLTETGNVVILTRGTDQTSEQFQTPSGFTRIYSRGYANLITGNSTSILPMESVASAQCVYFSMPLISAATNNLDTAFKYVALETINGNPAHHLQFWNTFASVPDLQPLASFSTRDVWIDATSGLPVKFSFASRASGGSASVPLLVDVSFSDYRTVAGIAYPFSVQVSLNGTLWATISIQNVSFNTGLSDSNFPVQLNQGAS